MTLATLNIKYWSYINDMELIPLGLMLGWLIAMYLDELKFKL